MVGGQRRAGRAGGRARRGLEDTEAPSSPRPFVLLCGCEQLNCPGGGVRGRPVSSPGAAGVTGRSPLGVPQAPGGGCCSPCRALLCAQSAPFGTQPSPPFPGALGGDAWCTLGFRISCLHFSVSPWGDVVGGARSTLTSGGRGGENRGGGQLRNHPLPLACVPGDLRACLPTPPSPIAPPLLDAGNNNISLLREPYGSPPAECFSVGPQPPTTPGEEVGTVRIPILQTG